MFSDRNFVHIYDNSIQFVSYKRTTDIDSDEHFENARPLSELFRKHLSLERNILSI